MKVLYFGETDACKLLTRKFLFSVNILSFSDRGFPIKHLILISTNGTIWDISLNENISPSNKKLFELPNSCQYHGYTDDKGILYVISGRLGSRKKMTKYHSSFGHPKVESLQNCSRRFHIELNHQL